MKEFAQFGDQARELLEGFFRVGEPSKDSLTTTGEKNLDCGSEKETTIYEFDTVGGTELPPIRSITGHAKNSVDVSDCPVTFKYYKMENKPGPKESAAEGQSTATYTGHWAKVTAKCEESEGSKPCRVSWTVST